MGQASESKQRGKGERERIHMRERTEMRKRRVGWMAEMMDGIRKGETIWPERCKSKQWLQIPTMSACNDYVLCFAYSGKSKKVQNASTR